MMRVALYSRVSTEEQVRSGFSLAGQLDDLRRRAAQEGWRVVEEVVDDGHSGTDPFRPGLRRITELAGAGEIDAVLAWRRDRFFRKRLYRLSFEEDLKEYGVRLLALDDTGNRIGDAVVDEVAEEYLIHLRDRTRMGRLRKARERKLVAFRVPNYGFRFNADRDGYEVVEEQAAVVHRIFGLIAEGHSINAVVRDLGREGIPSATGGKRWDTRVIKDAIMDDVYKPHTVEELAASGVAPQVTANLDPEGRYGVHWHNRRHVKTIRTPEGKKTQHIRRDRSEQIPVPVPSVGLDPPVVEAARAAVRYYSKPPASNDRFWELAKGILYCGGCGRRMTIQMTSWYRRSGERQVRFYYKCPRGPGTRTSARWIGTCGPRRRRSGSGASCGAC